MKPKSLLVFTVLTVIFLSISPIQAAIRLPAVISEHAMFQADKPVAIWGWAEPGEKVKVAFINEDGSAASEFIAIVDAKGKWFGKLPALKSGQTGKLKVTTDKGEEKTISDILVGEVWLGGGQSNMDSHPILREQQHAGLLLPKVGMASSIDLAPKNAHFPNKKPVGERLAGLALRDCYGLPMGQVNSPMFKSFSIKGNKIRLRFTDAEGLRVRSGRDLKGFAIHGSSGDWNWANGKIDRAGDRCVV